MLGIASQHTVSGLGLQRLIGKLDLGKNSVQVEVRHQQRERHARVVHRFHRRARGLLFLGNVKPQFLPVGDHQFVLGLPVVPAHQAAARKIRRAGLDSRGLAPGVRLSKGRAQGPHGPVARLDSTDELIEFRGGPRGACSQKAARHERRTEGDQPPRCLSRRSKPAL